MLAHLISLGGGDVTARQGDDLPFLEVEVLGLHRLHEPGGRRGELEKQRPKDVVLARVAHLEAAQAQAQVVGDDLGAAAIASLGR